MSDEKTKLEDRDDPPKDREVKHEAVLLSLTADAPRVRVKPKGQNIVLTPPSANMGIKGD